MTLKITDEIREAISAGHGQPVCVEDERTHRVYVVVDQDTHRRAMEALTEREDMAAIQAGIDDMEAGRHRPLADVDAEIRIKHNIPRET